MDIREIIRSVQQKFDELKVSYANKEDGKGNSQKILTAQIARLGLVVFVVLASVFGFFYISSGGAESKKRDRKEEANTQKKIKVEVASQALDPDRMWRNHFEDKLHETQETTNASMAKLAEAINASTAEKVAETRDELSTLKKELADSRRALEDAIFEIRDLSASVKKEARDKEFDDLVESHVESSLIDEDSDIEAPKDMKFYIPETSYVTGTLLGGISVSTSVGSSSEPVPVVIRLTGRGNLPKNFAADLKNCRILGSSYGDLSSERAIIRAESLVCEDRGVEEVITTKVAGLIYGDDGMNGVKGRVVDMSTKHIKNAAIGGILSGFAGTMKSEGQFTLSSVGAINTKQQGFGSRVKDNTLTGMSSAAEKIADYYIKQAENMSPVLLIPGGARVDVVFTKGVHLGSNNIVKMIENERKRNTNNTNEPR